MARVKAAIIGSGNIGTDLMMKMIKYPQNMELVAVVGIDPDSEGLAMARAHGIATTHEGIEGLKRLPCYAEIGIAFDATRIIDPQASRIIDTKDMLTTSAVSVMARWREWASDFISSSLSRWRRQW